MTAIAVHPTNPNIVYVGAAQGGVYRTLDGGTSWTAIFDSAQSLAIGALALAPSNPTILYVGTGEANGSADSYAGVGLYRIDNADTTPVLNGPINPVRTYVDGGGTTQNVPVFNGRSISKIVVHPTQPGTIFVGTTGGQVGIGGTSAFGGFVPPASLRGLWRSTNADAALSSIAFDRIKVSTSSGGFDNPNTGNRNINDIVMDPADPTGNTLIVWQNGTSTPGDGGVWRSTNAMAAPASAVTFAQTFSTTATSTSNGRAVFSYYHRGSDPTVIYEASGESPTGTLCSNTSQSGAIRRSLDGGQTWSAKLADGGGFAGGQGFYNLGLAVVAGASTSGANDTIHIGGNVSSSNSCTRLHGLSTDGGATFTNYDTGLHADTHVIVTAPSNPSIVFHGNDGGIWKSVDGGQTWTSLNKANFNATQFNGLALHPTDRNFMIGGTQDNGTEFMLPDGTWIRADSGDGGYAVIDQGATDTTNVTMYHTYFNQTGSLIGFARVTTAANAQNGIWSTFGAGLAADPNDDDDPDAIDQPVANGIGINDSVLFYAPMALGPGTPNTLYFGTDRLYRSTDRGTTMTVASPAPFVAGTPPASNIPISAIGISPQNDNVRIVGMASSVSATTGRVFATTTGDAGWSDVTGPIPARYIARAIIDPNNANTAYVALGGGAALPAGQHVWKTTNLSGGGGTWAASGTGIPDVPVNSLAVDPANSNTVFAATDIGVYRSTDGGSTWSAFGTGMPVVAVFDIAIQNANRIVRAATHGRGIFETTLAPVVTGITPATGVRGATLDAVIAGTNLTGATAVAFGATGGITVNSIGTVNTAGTSLPINLTIASGAALGPRDITVATSAGTSAALVGGFNVLTNTLPTVTSLNPAQAAQGATNLAVTITGTNFAGATAVSFGATGGITVNSIGTANGAGTSLPINITVAGAAPSGLRDITVTTPAGTSAALAGGFNIIGLPAINALSATPSGLSQGLAPWNGGSFVLTVNGTNFDGAAIVSLGGTNLATTQVSSTQLTAQVPASALTAVGSLTVTVTNPGSLVSNAVTLKVVERGDINANRSVNIGDALACALTVGGITKPLLVDAVGDTNLNGSTNIGDCLLLALFAGRLSANLQGTTITSVSPAVPSPGDTLTITGTGFSIVPGNDQVLFTVATGVSRVTPSAASATSLTVAVPANAVSGALQVYRIDAPIGGNEFPLIVTGSAPPLALMNVSPSFGVGRGTAVTLNGMGFSSTPASNTVLFSSATGTTQGTVTAVSASALTVTVPADAVCGPVTVGVSGQTSPARMVVISSTSCSLQLAGVLGRASPGETLVIEGSGFDIQTPANNSVTFTASGGGTVNAPVVQSGQTQLHVRVPATAVQGNVTVTVGSATSNAVLYKP